MTEATKVNRYGPVVGEVISQRTGQTYQVRQRATGGPLSCNCKGWAIRKTCKHTRAYSVELHPAPPPPTRPAAQPMPAVFLAIDRACHEAVGRYLPDAVLADLRAAVKLAVGPHVLPVTPVAVAVSTPALPGIRRIVLAD